jgi:hypothetical protein
MQILKKHFIEKLQTAEKKITTADLQTCSISVKSCRYVVAEVLPSKCGIAIVDIVGMLTTLLRGQSKYTLFTGSGSSYLKNLCQKSNS